MKQVTYAVTLKVVINLPDNVDSVDAFDDWDLAEGEVIASGHKASLSELLEVIPVEEVVL